MGDVALADPATSPRELAWQLTDRNGHLLSESSVYRILRAHDLITSPAYVVLSPATRFPHPTHRLNELWQTDFTYLSSRAMPEEVAFVASTRFLRPTVKSTGDGVPLGPAR